MIPKECKRLAEVDFPIAVVGKHSLNEKSIRTGTPHQLHLWWAWRPLAACRAMLLALLLPDPCDPHCPDDFKTKAHNLLSRLGAVGKTDKDLRDKLLKFVGDFANWDLSSDRVHLDVACGLVSAAHPDEKPLVVDPFAGGGSIPLEALRLGCEAFASDLNPVACLILNAKLRDIPAAGPSIVEDLTRIANDIAKQSEAELHSFYPADPDGAKPIAYLWARTVRCESPNCGAEIPLVRSFWLSKKDKRKRALRYVVVRPNGKPPYLQFSISEPTTDDDVPKATVSRAKATCPCCNITLPADRVRSQLSDQRSGANVVLDNSGERISGAMLLAVVTLSANRPGRSYRIATRHDYQAVWKAQQALAELEGGKLPNGLPYIPSEPTPKGGGSGAGRAFSLHQYGITEWRYLYSARQLLALCVLVRHAAALRASPVRSLLAITVAKLAERLNTSCDWMVDVECPGHLFTQQAIQTGWDYAEGNPLSESSGSFLLVLENTSKNIAGTFLRTTSRASVHVADATQPLLPEQSTAVWFTDPPYYDAIPYSDLSDFFYVWLKRILAPSSLLDNTFEPQNPLTPKCPEIVQDESKHLSDGRPKDRRFFEERMTAAFLRGRECLRPEGVGCVVFAHKTTEGWEALLTAMIDSAWVITASWPITTERSARTRARDSAALSSSVHLVCRPRNENAGVGDWGDVLRQLPTRVADWIERLQEEGVRGADLVFACIGPALEIFSRYSKVETAEGREVALAEYLAKVWEVVGRTALEQVLGTTEAKARNGGAGAVEEDGRLTALFLWTLQSTNVEASTNGTKDANDDAEEAGDDDDEESSPKPTKGYTLIFDVVRRFAQPLGIHLEDWENRIIETKKGVVRLLSVSERAKQLFGEDGASAVADRIESDAREARTAQMMLFPDEDAAPKVRGRGRGRKAADGQGAAIPDESLRTRREATTLDRVHAAMLLQASGRANALRSLLKAEQERGPDFMRLCNALTRLYPRTSEEKRLLDAMLLAVPR